MQPLSDMTLTDEGIEFICTKEGGVKTRAYKCSKNKDTVGVGHANDRFTIRGTLNGAPYEGRAVLPGLEITREEGFRLFRLDLAMSEKLVRETVRVPVSQPLYDMLVDLAFQIPSAFNAGSDILAALNGGFDDNNIFIGPHDYWRAQHELLRWKKVSGKADEGVYRRRLQAVCYSAGLPWRWIESDRSIGFDEDFASIRTKAEMRPAEAPNEVFCVPPLAPSASPPAPVEEIEAGPVETSTAPVPEPVASEPEPKEEAVAVAEEQKPPEPVGTKDVVVVPTDHKFDPDLPSKPMELSETFIGAVRELIGLSLKRWAARGGVLGTVGAVGWPIYQSMGHTPEAQMLLSALLVAACSMGVGAVGWVFGKAMEISGIKKKEQGRHSGVQLKH